MDGPRVILHYYCQANPSTVASSGHLSLFTSPGLRETAYAYNVDGSVRSVTRNDGTLVEYGYDAAGNVMSVTVPGPGPAPAAPVTYNFEYNGVNNVTVESHPPAASASRTYGIDYDTARRLTSFVYPDNTALTYAYDSETGRMVGAETPLGSLAITYEDGFGLKSLSRAGESIEYSYAADTGSGSIMVPIAMAVHLRGTLHQDLGIEVDARMRPASFTYAGGTEDFAYDLDGLLLQQGVFTHTRDTETGFVDWIESDDDYLLDHDVNDFGESIGVSVSVESSAIYSWEVGNLSPDGEILQRTDTVGVTANNYAYTYSNMGRLEEVRVNGVLKEEYEYDNNGNRTQDTRNGMDRYFDYDEEGRLTGVYSDASFTTPIAEYTYDANGSLASKTTGGSTTAHVYAATGELRSVTLPGKTITYVHDPMGRRIARSDGETTEKYLWAGMNQGLLAVYDGSDNIMLRFEYAGMRMPVAVMDYRTNPLAPVRYYLAYDQVGSLRAVANTSGVIVKTITYDAFGNALSDSNTALEFPLGFAGGFTDHDTGLIRFGYRDYDPNIGRWTTKDPIGLLGGDTNLYAYAGNSPSSFVDSEGRSPTLVTGAFGAGIGAVIGGGAAWLSGGDFGDIVYGAGRGLVAGGVTGLTLGATGPAVAGWAGGGIIGGALAGGTSCAAGELAGQSLDYATGRSETIIDVPGLTVSVVAGTLFGGALVRPANASSQLVTSWAPPGVSPTIQSGRWVMTGPPSPRTYGLSGVIEYGYPYGNSISGVVPGGSLSYPSGWEAVKGIFGQRLYTGSTVIK